MLFSIIKIVVCAGLFALPFAILNAIVFHNKGSPDKNVPLFITRLLFSAFVGALHALVLTHIVLTLSQSTNSFKWVYYVVGFFCSIPHFMRSQAKHCLNVDHVVDGVGMVFSLATYALVIIFWASFFSIPSNSGFLYSISTFIQGI